MALPAGNRREALSFRVLICTLVMTRRAGSQEERTDSSSLIRSLAVTEAIVPGVDFRAVRDMISMAEVLDLIGFVSRAISGNELRGPCPVHRSKSIRSRAFAVNVERKVYRCFSCGSAGNHLDLYTAVTRQSLFKATVALCEKLHHPIPWITPQRR
jgi:hypothetical protein